MQTVLGSHKRKFLFSCQGLLSETMAESFAQEFIHLAGMTPARPGRFDHYPYNGKGGEGYTFYQPLCESYLVVDVYTNIGEVEILLSTCKPNRIQIERLTNFLKCSVGEVKEIGTL